MSAVAMNTRVLGMPLTGQPRYTAELLSRLGDLVTPVAPARPALGVAGHAWEQAVLPARVGRRLLWSPSTTGPLTLRRQVVTVHDVAPLDHPEWFAPRFAAWYGWLLPRLAHRCAHVITISDFCRDRIADRFRLDPARITVARNGVDARFAPHSPAVQEAARRATGVPEGRYLLTVSSLEPRKNVAGLVRAWERVLPELPTDLSLVAVGARGVAHVFRAAQVDRLTDRLVLTGAVADEHLPGLYAGAAGFVYLSRYEGFGLPPLEAMASGVPVLVADRTALPEVVGSAGLLVDPDDDDDVAAALLRLVRLDPTERATRVASGRERAASLSWDRTADSVRDVLARWS